MKTAGSGHGIQPDSSVFVAYTLAPTWTQPELLACLDDRGPDVLAFVPGAEQLEAGDAGHAVVQGAHLVARDRELAQVEEA